MRLVHGKHSAEVPEAGRDGRLIFTRRVRGTCIWAMVILALPAARGQPTLASQQSKPHPQKESLNLENEALQLHFQIEGGQARLVRIENKWAGTTWRVASDGFQIGLEGQAALGPDDFILQKADQEQLPGGGQRLVFHYTGKKPGLTLDIVYELGAKDFFVRRWLQLHTESALDLRQVAVWELRFSEPDKLTQVQQGGGPPVHLNAWASWRLPRAETHGGFGNPVFLADTFWGLEFPAGINGYENGLLRLVHHPGRRIQGQWTSKPAVLGVAEPGRVLKRFRQYVASFQASPPELNLFVNYNTWWTLMPPTEQNCIQLIETFRKNLWEPFGQSFDTFTIDDGWDEKNSLWEIQKERFPRGFEPVGEELKKMNARLGLWVSPSSGYNHAPWGAKAGYEVNSNPWYLCQSGPKYRRDFMRVMLDLTKRYQFAFYKFDGFCASCEAPGHGHLPGLYAQEANTEAFIELLEAIRREKPDIFLDPTTGMWLSPWWLQYVDSIWGSVSGDYPDIVVPAPIVRDSATTTRDAVFRQRCQQHPGFPPAAIEHLGIIVITPEKWEDNAAIVVGRGCRLLTLYINPECFTKGRQDWAFLASLLRWTRHNAAILANTELILGDPFQREPYGYAHWRDGRGILALRNPFIDPRKVRISLDETIGWESAQQGASQAGSTQAQTFGQGLGHNSLYISFDTLPSGSTNAQRDTSEAPKNPAQKLRLVARIVYPRYEVLPKIFGYGNHLELELSAYETVLVELVPVDFSDLAERKPAESAESAKLTKTPASVGAEAEKAAPGGNLSAATPPLASSLASAPPLAGLPVRELRRQDRLIEYELFGPPGQKLPVRLPPGVQAAWLDGEPLALADPSASLEVPFPGQPPGCKVENVSQKVVLGDGGQTAWKIEGTAQVQLSSGVQAALHILFDPKTSPVPPVDCQVKLGDRAVEVRAVRSPEKRVQTHLPHRWTWFEAPLPEGEHQITWTIQPMAKDSPAAAGKAEPTPSPKPGQIVLVANPAQTGPAKAAQTGSVKPPLFRNATDVSAATLDLTGPAKPGSPAPTKAEQTGSDKPPYLVAEMGCWVWAEKALARRELRLQFADSAVMPSPPPPWPLPIQMDRQRQIISVQPVGPVRIGSRWTGIRQAVVWLDQISPNLAEQAWGRLQRGKSVWEKPMTIAGKTYTSGLGTHAESRIAYDLAGGGFKKFRAYIGRDQHAMDGQVIFEVWLDGRKVFQSPPMRKDSPAQLVELDVEGAEWLELRSLPGDDGITGDHANWADAQLLRQ